MLPCFSAAKSGPLAPSGSASWGQGSCLGPPVWECALHRAPSSPPSFSRGTGRTSPSPCPTSSLGTERTPTNLCLCLGGRGEGLLPLGKAAGVCPSGPTVQLLQGQQLRAAPCIIQATTSDFCLNQPWGLAPPALSVGA
uniref:Uncharacterized protein n=1 Tax=Colobus angolensis palliatus TaxID=336983 RepID=A0A2K5I1H3_COLAP